LFELEFQRHGGDTYEWNSEGMGRGLDLGFTQETDKNVFLESAFSWVF